MYTKSGKFLTVSLILYVLTILSPRCECFKYLNTLEIGNPINKVLFTVRILGHEWVMVSGIVVGHCRLLIPYLRVEVVIL